MDELKILITEEDKYGSDIFKMSDFCNRAISDLNNWCNIGISFDDLPLAEIGIVQSAFAMFGTCTKNGVTYVLDMESLSEDIQKGLKDGTYTIGDSKQYSGDKRAVVVDKKGTRVKDIGVKQAVDKGGNKGLDPNAINNLLMQMQMKQINDKLDYIITMMDFLVIARRDETIKKPFFEARDKIRKAQDSNSEEEREGLLKEALEKLENSILSAYQDVLNSSQEIVKLKKKIIFTNEKELQQFMSFVTEDWGIIAKATCIKIQILCYLKDQKNINDTLKDYMYKMNEFCSQKAPGQKNSYAMLIHLIFPYSYKNKNSWYKMIETNGKTFSEFLKIQDSQEVCLLKEEV